MRALVGATRARRTIASGLALGVVLSLPGATGAAEGGHDREITVMTRNVYLGADLAPVLGAASQQSFIQAVAAVYGQVQSTDFPARAAAIAREIDRADADLVGLQEVTTWTATGPGAPASMDFLAILLRELADRGLSYSVASTADNASFGPVPLLLCTGSFGSCLLGYHDRDVILVNDRTRDLQVVRSNSGRYVAQQLLTTPVGVVSFDRGWASIDARLDGVSFRFLTTHLETEDLPAIQEAQARELLAGPARSRRPVIAAGDFNSAADGSTTTTYDDLTTTWFDDTWRTRPRSAGDTCCQTPSLSKPVSRLSSRIDLVLTHDLGRPSDVVLVGDVPFQHSVPYWASDHAGIVATVRIP